MKRVKFKISKVVRRAGYNAGDVAGFPNDVAEGLVSSGAATWADPPATQTHPAQRAEPSAEKPAPAPVEITTPEGPTLDRMIEAKPKRRSRKPKKNA